MLKRLTLAALVLVLGLALPVWATDIATSDWNQTDASNTAASPNGITNDTAPSAVDDIVRAIRGAVKRFWVHVNCTIASTGTGDAHVLTYSVAPAALVNGEMFCFEAGAANTTTATININSLGIKNIQKHTSAGLANLSANDIRAGDHVLIVYDSSSDVYIMLSRDPNAVATGTANTFTASQTFQSTDAGAAAAPSLTLDRDSASAADGDDIGSLLYLGNDDAGSPNTTTYAELRGEIIDSGDGSEDAAIDAYSQVAGTLTLAGRIGGGGWTVGAAPTSGAIAAGTINADVGYYLDGAKVPAQVNVVVYTSDDTYTAPADLVYAIVEVVGGGGGGGGADAATTAGACGGGGGGGGYARELLTAAEIGASQAVDVGAAGTAGSTAGGDGGDGADTTFGALLTGGGGGGGAGSGSNTDNNGATGAIAGDGTGGDLNLIGQGGGNCITITTSKALGSYGGSGGGGLGVGGKGQIQKNSTDNTGLDGKVCGGGGAGATDDDTAGSAGGAGAAGCVIITEFNAVP